MEKVVLIVEDSPTVRFHIKALLSQIGLRLREAGGEIGMFNLIEQYGKLVDLIIMDLTLRNEEGFELIKKLKSNELYKDIPILILSEHADVESVLTARNLGVEGYIRKPLNKDIILGKISDILKLTITTEKASEEAKQDLEQTTKAEG